MAEKGHPMTPREAYSAIIQRGLYVFLAQDPVNVVTKQIRRHCRGLDLPRSHRNKYFKLVDSNRYWLADHGDEKVLDDLVNGASGAVISPAAPEETLQGILSAIDDLHAKYVRALKERMLADLRDLHPTSFEIFAKQLLSIYGFEQAVVTRASSDGGIDGHGRLRVGLAHLNVAFQCKRWRKGRIQRTDIDQFRGAIQGEFEQGIYFSTAPFSKGAVEASIRRGAVPVVLLDGPAIVDLMMDRKFGVQVETLSIPTYALDMALSTE